MLTPTPLFETRESPAFAVYSVFPATTQQTAVVPLSVLRSRIVGSLSIFHSVSTSACDIAVLMSPAANEGWLKTAAGKWRFM